MSRTLRSVGGQCRPTVNMYRGNIPRRLTFHRPGGPERERLLQSYRQRNRTSYRQRINAIRIDKRFASRQRRANERREMHDILGETLA